MRALDDALPRFDVNEVHSISLRVAPTGGGARPGRPGCAGPCHRSALPRAWPAPETSIGALFDRMGFDALAATPTEAVFAASGTPWRPSGGLRPFAADVPGTVRVAADIRAIPVAGGCILSTETRVQAVDDRARRAFRRYWLVVGPFSGLIRRRWLRAVERVCP